MHQHQQYPISDLYEWIQSGALVLAPEFQRSDIWQPSAQSYFIDTLLRDLPIPSIYIRVVTDRETRTSYRQVVDGQQRLTTIVKFIDGKLTLDKRSNEFAGKSYNTLDGEDQERFLAYQVGVEQLFGADDDTVLGIFHRINAYGLSLNRQELLGIILEGATDGGQPRIDKLYEKYGAGIPNVLEERFDEVCSSIIEHLPDVLTTKLGTGPHFMMIFAAVAHVALRGLPKGDMGGEHPDLPALDPLALSDPAAASPNLLVLADIFDLDPDDVPERLKNFKVAIAGTTQRIKSRSRRFVTIYRALLPDPI